MSVARIKTSEGWADLQRSGLRGDTGPQGPPGLSTGPAGGDLSGNFPNPTVVKASGPSMTIAGRLLIPTPGSAAGILLGPDASLYRHSNLMLRTNSSFYADGNLVTIGGDVQITNDHGVLSFGVDSDTNLYRALADTLKTDDNLLVAGALTVGAGSTEVYAGGGVLKFGGVNGDTNLYRATADMLRTDDFFTVIRTLHTDPAWGSHGGSDTQFRHMVLTDGYHSWGPGTLAGGFDTNLYRNEVGSLKTDGIFYAKQIITTDVAGNPALYANANGDGNYRIFIAHDGTITWRDGGSGEPVSLSRSGPESLIIAGPTGGNLHVTGKYTGKGAVPLGGTTGQVLAKMTATDHAVSWIDPPTAATVTAAVAKASTTAGGGTVNVATGWVALPLPPMTIEPSDAFTISSNNVTVKDAGWYHVSATMFNGSAATNLFLSLSTSPTGGDGDIANNGSSGVVYNRVGCSGSVKLAAGAKVYVYGWSNSASPVNCICLNFSIERVGGPKGDKGDVGATGGNATVPIEAWRIVGAVGQPAFNIAAGWAGHSDPTYTVRFRKRPDGIVEIQGIARGGAADSTVFTLPAGYWPEQIQYLPIARDPAGANTPGAASSYVTVWTDGRVSVGNDVSATKWVSLSNIRFPTDQATFPTGPQGPKGDIGNYTGMIPDPSYRKIQSSAAAQSGPANNALWAYNAAGAPYLDLTPGTWMIEMAASLTTNVSDYVMLAVYDETAGAIISYSGSSYVYIPAGASPWRATNSHMVTVASGTRRYRIAVVPNGGSTQTITQSYSLPPAFMSAYLVGPGPVGPQGPKGDPGGLVAKTPAYTVSGIGVDRSITNITTMNEIVTVLGTLINDLRTAGVISP